MSLIIWPLGRHRGIIQSTFNAAFSRIAFFKPFFINVLCEIFLSPALSVELVIRGTSRVLEAKITVLIELDLELEHTKLMSRFNIYTRNAHTCIVWPPGNWFARFCSLLSFVRYSIVHQNHHQHHHHHKRRTKWKYHTKMSPIQCQLTLHSFLCLFWTLYALYCESVSDKL